jgi:membrane protease YdiL (CAAX protease family)
MPTVIHHLLVAFLILVMPVWDRYEMRRLKASSSPRKRVQSYQMTLLWLWVATALLLVTTARHELFAPVATTLMDRYRNIALPAIIGLGIGALIPVLIARAKPREQMKQVKALGDTALILPRTSEERWWFAAVSVSAGICEEIIFRGFLIRYFATPPLGLGVGAAIIAAALVFGIAHGYQGWKGVLVTAVLALVMTALFYATGSLVLPIVVHALLDLRILLMRFSSAPDHGPARASMPLGKDD